MAKVKFKRVNNAQDLIDAYNDNREDLANGKKTLDQARQETHGLSKILIAARTDIAMQIAAGKEPRSTFFGPIQSKPKGRKKQTGRA